MNLIFEISRRIKPGKGGSRSSNTIATLSVAISTAVIIIAIAVTGGFKGEIRDKVSGFFGDITIGAAYSDITDWRTPAETLEFKDIPKEIASISPVWYRSAILKYGTAIQGLVIKGTDASYDTTFFARNLTEGRLPKPDSYEILLSQRTASALGCSLGESISAIFVDEENTFKDSDYMQLRTLTVCGLYDARLEEMDKGLALADRSLVMEANAWGDDKVSGYEVKLKEFSYNTYLERLQHLSSLFAENGAEAFGAEGQTKALMAVPANRSAETLFNWLELLNMNVLIILVLMIAVASFNMVSGLLITLFEKSSEIGVLKSMGMHNRSIWGIFLISAARVVAKGMLIGDAMAIILSLVQKNFKIIGLNPESYFTDAVPIVLGATDVIAVNLISFMAIMAVMLIPCRAISKASPAKSIRFN